MKIETLPWIMLFKAVVGYQLLPVAFHSAPITARNCLIQTISRRSESAPHGQSLEVHMDHFETDEVIRGQFQYNTATLLSRRIRSVLARNGFPGLVKSIVQIDYKCTK